MVICDSGGDVTSESCLISSIGSWTAVSVLCSIVASALASDFFAVLLLASSYFSVLM